MKFLDIIFLFNFLLINFVYSKPLQYGNPAIWESEFYPNPLLKENIEKCHIRRRTFLCDPDEVLTSEARERVIGKLMQANERVSENCETSKFVVGVAIAKKFLGGYSKTLKIHSNDLLEKWKLDKRCRKALLITVAVEDRSLWVSKDLNVAIPSETLTKYFEDQKRLLRQQKYEEAITNVVEQISSYDSSNEWKIFFIILIVFVLIIIFGICLCYFIWNHGGDGGGGGSGGYSSGSSGGYGGYSSGGGGGGGDSSGGGGGDW